MTDTRATVDKGTSVAIKLLADSVEMSTRVAFEIVKLDDSKPNTGSSKSTCKTIEFVCPEGCSVITAFGETESKTIYRGIAAKLKFPE